MKAIKNGTVLLLLIVLPLVLSYPHCSYGGPVETETETTRHSDSRVVLVTDYISGGMGSQDDPYVGENGQGGIGEAITEQGSGHVYYLPAGY